MRLVRTGMGLGREIRLRTKSRWELRWRLASGFVTRIGARVRGWDGVGTRVSGLDIVRE